MIETIQRCFRENQVYYTRHARNEMLSEALGVILDSEIEEAIQTAEVIEDYPDDEPFPSMLLFGKTAQGRPLHVVCAYDSDDKMIIIVTTYEPDPLKWIDFKRRIQ